MIEHLAVPLEFKFASNDAGAMTFAGYGAVFGNVDSHGDVIARGAFSKTLADARATGHMPAMLEQHGGWGMSAGDMTPIGVWTGLAEDDTGLKVEGKLAPTPRGQEMHALMKMGAISGLSIGYQPIKFKAGNGTPDSPRRTLEEIKLYEISPVTFPANAMARVGSVKARPTDIRTFEAYLRDAMGFSGRDAKRLASGGWKALERRDDDSEELQELVALLKGAAKSFSPN